MVSKIMIYLSTLSAILLCVLITYCMVFKTPPSLPDSNSRQSHTIAPSSTLNTSEKASLPQQHSYLNSQNVIFDLHGVLFTISQKKAVEQLGMFDLLGYTMSGNKVEDLEDLIFDILSRIEGYSQPNVDPNQLVPLHNGKVLPPIMCSWMQGTISSNAVVEVITNEVEKLYTENYFKNRSQKKLVLKIITIMFDPVIRATLYKPLKKGVAIMHECKEQGHHIYLLSNMDSELIGLLKQKYPEIFELFDGMIISADVGMIKPDTAIYTHALKTFGLDPATCFFIDDQKENILGAKKVGIKAIHHSQRKTKKTRRKLDKLGILPLKIVQEDAASV